VLNYRTDLRLCRRARLRSTRRAHRREAPKQSAIQLSAQGHPFDQKLAAELAGLDEIALICGRYEGVDERVNTDLADRELSIGDYVLRRR